MNGIIPITREETNAEILARIVKAESRKYDCSMEIDFSQDNRISKFVGDESLKPHIIEDVHNIFDRRAL